MEFFFHIKKIFPFWTFPKKSAPRVEHSSEGSLLPILAPLKATTLRLVIDSKSLKGSIILWQETI